MRSGVNSTPVGFPRVDENDFQERRLWSGKQDGGRGQIPRRMTGPSTRQAVIYLLFSQREYDIFPVGNQNDGAMKKALVMKQKADVLQGTLALMVLKTLEVLGPQHGYGIARRIEQISGDLLAVNQGTLYPVVFRLEQEGGIASEGRASENNSRARFYSLTKAGRKHLDLAG